MGKDVGPGSESEAMDEKNLPPFEAGGEKDQDTRTEDAYFLAGSLIFWPTFKAVQFTPELTAFRSSTETPLA